MFSFTDDKAKRDEINKNLLIISASVANLLRKTKGRARQQLENRVKKLHVFQDQLKSWQGLQSQMEKLEIEIDESKKKIK